MLLIYHDFSQVYALEEIVADDAAPRQKQRQAFEQLKMAICHVLLALHEKVNHEQVSKRVLMQHCTNVNLDMILGEKDLFSAFPMHGQVRPLLTKEQEQKKMEAAIEQMSQLNVSMGGEIKQSAEIQHAIERRLIQTLGDLLEYNPLQDDHILRVKDVFLCVDKLAGRPNGFMLNIVDGA